MKKETSKKIKEAFFSPAGTLGLFALAVLLLLGSSVGGAQAALTYFSETYSSRVQMYDIGVSLCENGEIVSRRDYDSENADGTWEENTGALLENMLAEGEVLRPGKAYREELNVRNSGTINQYVRVSVQKYWMVKKTAPDGTVTYEKSRDSQALSPSLIDLHLLCDATGVENGWMLDEKASTEERTVLYYGGLLYAQPEEGEAIGASETPPFADTLTIDEAVGKRVEQETFEENGRTRIVTTYQYDDVRFQLEVRVDTIQEHNAEDAALSAWGRKVSVENGALKLAD